MIVSRTNGGLAVIASRATLALALAAAMGLAVAPAAATDEPDRAVKALEQRIAELEAALADLKADDSADPRIAELERAVEVLGREIESLRVGDAESARAQDTRSLGLGPAAAKVYRVDRGVSIGGYGEMLYESFDSTREDGTPSGATDQLDFLRAIVYLGYKFNDRIVFNSEIEFEHASTGKDGEVSVEFAYLDFLVRDEFNVRAGMFLAPLGFVNELHEAPVFLGTERPLVEQRIIPSTWRENGVGVFGESGVVSYRAYVGSGLTAVSGTPGGASGYSAGGVRGGRQSGSKSAVEDLGMFGRLDVEPVRGLTFGVSAFTGDTGQGAVDSGGVAIGGRTTIWDAHVDWRWRALQVRALYAATSIDDVARINDAQGLSGNGSVGESQYGWYGEVGYDVLAGRSSGQSLVPYLRYERVDTQETVPAGFASNPANDVTVTTVGVAWKPIVNVVVKADFNRFENEAETGVDQFNVALGYLF